MITIVPGRLTQHRDGTAVVFVLGIRVSPLRLQR